MSSVGQQNYPQWQTINSNSYNVLFITCREYDRKVNLKWNSDESLISYNQNKYYVFVPEKSVGDPRDYNITVLNFPLLVSCHNNHVLATVTIVVHLQDQCNI